MKKITFILIFAIIITALTVSVGAVPETLDVSGASVTASASETVNISLTVNSNPGFAYLNLYYVLDDGLTLNSVTNKFTSMGFYHDQSSLWDNTANNVATGELAVLSVTVADNIKDGIYEIKIICVEAFDENYDDVAVTATSAFITVGNDETETITLSDKISVFEMKATYTARGEGTEALISCTKGDAVFDLLYADKATGVLKFKTATGDYEALYSKDGSVLSLGTNPVSLAVIYDDIRGTVRYFVNGFVPYYGIEESRVLANDIAVNADFVNAQGSEKIEFLVGSFSDVKAYNIHDLGTAEIVAFQDHTEANNIRILSCVDMPWYSTVGFDVEVYIDGVGQGEKTLCSNTIFESVIANNVEVFAKEEYGYNYFAAVEIDDVDVTDENIYYVIAKPFTRVGSTKYFGKTAKIYIDADGKYSFDENYN